MSRILELLDESTVDFLNTKARKLLLRSVWDALPSALRADLERRSVDELRQYAWCFVDDGQPLVSFSQGDLRNVGRAVQRLGVQKDGNRIRAFHSLCPAAKIGMTPKVNEEGKKFCFADRCNRKFMSVRRSQLSLSKFHLRQEVMCVWTLGLGKDIWR
jgi:hypothetical protein